MRRLQPGFAALVLAAAIAGPAAAQEPPPPGAVAQIGSVSITQDTFDVWFAVGVRSFRADGVTARERRAATRETMQFLIQREWVRGEAALRGIQVSAARVRRAFERQRSQAFANRRDYRRFLRQSGLTTELILERVEVDLLQQVLLRKVLGRPRVSRSQVDNYIRSHRPQLRGLTRAERRRRARAHVRAVLQIRALDRFVADLRFRWRGMTVCASGYVVPDCSNSSPGR